MPIFIDNRGKGEQQIALLLEAKRIPIEVKYLESGDFVIEDIGIERKTVPDLLNTLYSKQKGHSLWDQIKILKDTYKKSLFIIEGYVDEEDRLLNAVLYGILVGWQLPIIYTSDINHTVRRLIKIFDKYGKTRSVKIPPPAVIKGKTVKEIKWCMLQTIPHLGPTKARDIINAYPYLFSGEYCRAGLEKEFKKIKGLNKEAKKLLIDVLCDNEVIITLKNSVK